jgi:hypothetical protein
MLSAPTIPIGEATHLVWKKLAAQTGPTMVVVRDEALDA